MMTDTIADMLNRIRNAQSVRQDTVSVPYSGLKEDIAELLAKENFIEGIKDIKEGPQGEIVINLKYENDDPAITSIQRESVPGHRKYAGKDEIPVIKNGFGMAIISTSHGIMSDAQARKEGVGGEVICSVY